MDAELNKEITRLKNLKGTENQSDSEITERANINLKVRKFKSENMFSDEEEQKLAEEKFK